MISKNLWQASLRFSEPVIDVVLDLSGHRQTEHEWKLIKQKLKQFAFTMQPGVPIREIKIFERKIGKSLPWDMRVSLMMCAFIDIPPIFDNLSEFEQVLDPLEGTFVREADVDRWTFDPLETDEEIDAGKRWFGGTNYKNVVRLTSTYAEFNAGWSSYDIYWNIKTKRLLYGSSSSNGGGDSYCYLSEHASWRRFMQASTKNVSEEHIASIYERQDVDWTFVESLDEREIHDIEKMHDCLYSYSGRSYNDRTLREIMKIHNSARIKNKKRKLDEKQNESCPAKKKLKM